MKLLLSILAIFRALWLVSCSSFDIRNNVISGNVSVYHGYYMNIGKYVMLVGYEDPIRRVTFGEGVMFPEEKDEGQGHEYLVEIFENFNQKFVQISCFKKCEEEMCYDGSHYYIIILNSPLKLTKSDFVRVIGSPVWLYFDIKPGRKHPYMEREKKMENNNKVVEYKIGRSYRKKEINESGGIEYKMGTAYDTSTEAMIGYKLFSNLMNKFDSVRMEYRLMLNKLIFKDGSRTVKYIYTKYYCRNVWKAEVEKKSDLEEMVKAEAYEMPRKLMEKGIQINPIIIDVSEVISPKSFSVEKTEGTAGSWEYTLYQVPNDRVMDFKINKIIDTKSEEVIIWEGNREIEETMVEVYKYLERWIVVVTSWIPGALEYAKVVNVYDRKKREGKIKYKELIGDEKTYVLETLKLIIPIAISVSINEETTRVYSKEIRVDRNGKYIYLTINPVDSRAIDSERKYSFGIIKQRRKYEVGNIPRCAYQKEEIVAKIAQRYLSSDKNIIITNSKVPQDLSHLEMERYEIIYKEDLE